MCDSCNKHDNAEIMGNYLEFIPLFVFAKYILANTVASKCNNCTIVFYKKLNSLCVFFVIFTIRTVWPT